MKKMMLGLTWQVMGFLGSIIIICAAALQDETCNGFTDLLDSLFGLCLIVPLIVCVILFTVGVVLCLAESKEK